MTARAFISLGSNLDDPLRHVCLACEQLNQHAEIQLVQHSPWYGSAAVGPGHQPDYVNGVAELSTTLNPLLLLQALQDIEQLHDRVRLERWGARTLDLDLLWYDEQQIDLPDLHVPHPRISQRNFVLFPFNDIAPDILLDGKQSIAELTAQITGEGIWAL